MKKKRIAWNKGLKGIYSDETRKKISDALRKRKKKPESLKKWKKKMAGYKHSDETKKKISDSNKEMLQKMAKEKTGKKRPRYIGEKISKSKKGKATFSGDNHPNWKGGISFLPYNSKWTETLKRAIRERDNYVCRICYAIQGDIAHDVHHIDYDKMNCDEKNLITLCKSCHMKTNYKRKYWKEFFKKIVS